MKGTSPSDGKQAIPSTSSYLGLTAATSPEKPPMRSCFTIWLPGESNFGLAPTTTTERASSMVRWASFATAILSPAAQGQAFLQALPATVAPDLPHAVVRRDGAYTTTGVRGRRGLVEAPYRGPVVRVTWGRPHVEELLGRELAVEDVPPDEPDLLLHVVRPEHLTVHDRTLEVRRQLSVAVDHTVRVCLELLPVGLLRPFVRDPLRKERHYVVPLRAERAVEDRGYDAVGERPARRLSAPRVLESLLYVVNGVGQLYGPAKVLPPTGVGGEIGQLRECKVDLDDPAAGVPPLDAPNELLGQLFASELLEEGDPRVRRRHHEVSLQLLAALEHHASYAPVPLQNTLDRRVGPYFRAELLRRTPQGVGDGPHTSPGISPGAEAEAGVPDLVVHQDVRRPRGRWTGPRPDDAVDRHRALHLRRLEPVVEQVPGAHRHEPGELADAGDIQSPHPPRQLQLIQEVEGMPGSQPGRRRQQQGLHDPCQLSKPLPPPPVRLRIPARKPRERLMIFRGVYAGHGQGSPVGESVVRRSHRIDLVPVMLQSQLVDDAPGHQAHHVRVRGDVELRRLPPGRVGRSRPADLVAGLEHHRPQPVAGEIGPRSQPVVPPADDYGLVTAPHHPLLSQTCDQS